MTFKTVNETVKSEHISYAVLRRMIKQGTAPGYYAGTRFYFNIDRLREMLDASTSGTKEAQRA